jgi:hypothetical protein
MEELEELLQHLKRELEITNSCLHQSYIQEGFRQEIAIIEQAIEILEYYQPFINQ